MTGDNCIMLRETYSKVLEAEKVREGFHTLSILGLRFLHESENFRLGNFHYQGYLQEFRSLKIIMGLKQVRNSI